MAHNELQVKEKHALVSASAGGIVGVTTEE
jgi:hypothetical protein